MIITPPAKEKKSEHQDSAVKTEKDWLSLPKNIPKENISLSDPNIHPRLIHKDRSICHSKTYWKSLNKKPPLKEFELPDLFSDDEELEIKGHNKSEQTEVTTISNKTTGKKGLETNEPLHIENPNNVKEIMTTIEAPITKGNNVPTNVVTTETDTKGESDKNNNMPENSVNTDNVENSGDRRTQLPGKSPALNTDASEKIENPTNIELQERNTTSSTSMTVDTEKTNNHENSRSIDVTSVLEPNVTTEKTELLEGNDTSTTAMTVNTEKTNNHENSRSIDVTNESEPNVTTEKTNDHESSRSGDVTGESEPNVTTEKTEESMTTRETDTQDKETSVNNQMSSNQQAKTIPNEDWASLMFHSDDSLFEEMMKQVENNQDRSEPVTKEPTSMATQNFDTLPDIISTQNKTEAAKGLLMLSLNSNDVDAEIDNERDMPINPKAHNKDNTVDNDNNQKTPPKNSSDNENEVTPRRSSRRSKNKNKVTPESTSSPKGGITSPKNSGSSRGVLTVTCYNLKKGTPNRYVQKPLKCTMCDQEVNSKSELRDHHQKVHNTISCDKCNKGFATNKSLRKHAYTHTAGNSYECLYCRISFTFPSELDAHMIKHESTPNHHCNIVGCKRSYFRKAELTAHIKTHDEKLLKCPHRDCSFEAIDKRYLTAHKKKHSNKLNYHCRHCTEGFKYFEQRKRHEKTLHGK